MDFRLAREIYSQAWYIDYITLQSLTAQLEFLKNGNIPQDKTKLNQSFLYKIDSESVIASKPYQLKDLRSDDKAISLINLNGPITKHGGASHYGTVELASKLKSFESDERIVGHILSVESGGGSVSAVAELTDVMSELNKPIVTFADGIMASAAMYIGSYSDYIISHRAEDQIGSIGTMIEFSGFPQKSEDKTTGERHVRIYADQSTNKNDVFEEALNNLNFKPMKEKILNPLNEKFIAAIKNNRPNVKSTELTGSIFFASDVVGTLIDEIGSFDQAINKVLELSEASTSSNININQNSKNMTVQELKQDHPDLYNSIVKSERDRVSAYLEFADIDLKSCVNGIESGDEPTSKFFAEMARKNMSIAQLSKTEEEVVDEIKSSDEKKLKQKESAESLQDEIEVYEAAGLNYEEVK